MLLVPEIYSAASPWTIPTMWFCKGRRTPKARAGFSARERSTPGGATPSKEEYGVIRHQNDTYSLQNDTYSLQNDTYSLQNDTHSFQEMGHSLQGGVRVCCN